MEINIEDEILTLAKKYDMILSQFDNFLKEFLLFKLFISPREVLPDYEKKYYKIAIKKDLLSEFDIMNLREWRRIRNFLTHEPDKNVIPYFDEYNKKFQLVKEKLELLQQYVIVKIKKVGKMADCIICKKPFELKQSHFWDAFYICEKCDNKLEYSTECPYCKKNVSEILVSKYKETSIFRDHVTKCNKVFIRFQEIEKRGIKN